MKKVLLFIIALLAGSSFVIAQDIFTIKGKITTVAGEIISGATINAVKSKHHSLSDNNGTFTIDVYSSDTLFISCIGYINKKVFIPSKSKEIHINLELSDNQLTDVTINTGYQTLKPNEATGSFEVIDNKT